jgi:predicted nucleotidyltransferase component of viral defense system
VRSDLSPFDQLLLEGVFTADDMSDLVRVRAAKRLAWTVPAPDGPDASPTEPGAQVPLVRSEGEIDYALARFVAANCAVAGAFTDSPTPFVLKGGLAVFACFAGPRRSKDADMSPSSLEVEIEGLQPPDLITAPAGMRLLDPTQETDDGWRIPIEFTTTTGDDQLRAICDLNKAVRVIRRQPAIKRPFDSPFTTAPLMVWVACPEEIIAEKTSALLRRRNGRLRDILDIGHLLDRAEEIDLDVAKIRPIAVEAILELLEFSNLKQAVRDRIETRMLAANDLSWVKDEIGTIGRNAKAKDWKEQVADVVIGAPSILDATDHLLERWSALGLLEVSGDSLAPVPGHG